MSNQPGSSQPAFSAEFSSHPRNQGVGSEYEPMPSPDDNSDDAWARRVQRIFPTRQHAVTAFAASAAPVLLLGSLGFYNLVTFASDEDICKTGKKLEAASNNEGWAGKIDELYFRLFDKYATQVEDYRGPNDSQMPDYAKEIRSLQKSSNDGGDRRVDPDRVLRVTAPATRLACSTSSS